jgi:hypothetical protein
MKRLLTTVALLGACLPAYADTSSNSAYQLPADTVLKVQVLVDKSINKGETVSHLLLKATGSTGASLPERCLMSANAEINNNQLEVSVNRALCVEPNGDIFDGAMNARMIGANNDFGLKLVCTSNSCDSALLRAGEDYKLRLLDSANVALVVNQTEQINIQRRSYQPDSNSAQ